MADVCLCWAQCFADRVSVLVFVWATSLYFKEVVSDRMGLLWWVQSFVDLFWVISGFFKLLTKIANFAISSLKLYFNWLHLSSDVSSKWMSAFAVMQSVSWFGSMWSCFLTPETIRFVKVGRCRTGIIISFVYYSRASVVMGVVHLKSCIQDKAVCFIYIPVVLD